MDLSKLTKLPQVGKQMQAEVNRTLIILRKRTATRTGAAEEEFVIKTVDKAKAARKIRKPLFIHSDRGSHYKADTYIKATEKMKRSYSKMHYPYDNACIESFHSLIKREWLYRFQIQGYNHCRSLVLEYIETFYNTKLIHSHCGFISPNEYEVKFQNKKSEKYNKKAT